VKDAFRVKSKDLLGRIGDLWTRSGVVHTPTLAPVISVSGGPLSAKEIKDMGFELVITNAYLWMKRGEDRDIHEVLGVNGPIMTDSGAYQLLVYGSVDVTNEQIIRYQEKIHSDIGVVLDVPTGIVTKDEAERTVKETLSSELEALKLISDEDVVWTAPVQGGTHLDLVKQMVDQAKSLDYPLYALGSPTPLMEGHRYAELFDLLYEVRVRLPSHKPLHLFGAGHPSMFPFAVALGADTFDSAAYALFAKEGRYMTSTGSEKLENLKEFPCACPVCSTHTPSEVLRMDKKEREKFLAKHNLYVSIAEIRTIKNAINEGRLWDLVESRARAASELWEAFKRFERYSDGFLKHTAVRKIGARGFSVIDEMSTNRPELLWHITSVQRMISGRSELTIALNADELPEGEGYFLAGFPFVLTPKQLLKVYPLYFAKYQKLGHEEELEFLGKKIVPLVRGKKVHVIGDQSLVDLLKERGVDADLIPAPKSVQT